MKIRTVVLFSFSALIAAGAAFLYQWTTNSIRPSYLKVVEENLIDTSRLFSSLVTDRLREGDHLIDSLSRPTTDFREDRFLAQIYDATKTESDLQFYVTDSQGMVLFHSHAPGQIGEDYSRWNDVRLTLEGVYGARSTRMDPEDPSTSHLHVAAPIRFKDETIGVLTIIKPIGWPYQFMEEARIHVLKGAIVITIAALILIFFLSRWLTTPIEKVTNYAASVSRGERASLPRLGMVSEVKRLGQAVEDMKSSLEGKKYVETYVANLTHEIKSPMAGIRAAAEILKENPPDPEKRRFLEIIRTEGDRVHRIIDRMLTLVELEGTEDLEKREKVDLPALVDAIRSEYMTQAEAVDVDLTIDSSTGIFISGDRRLLAIAIANIVSNAIEFSPKGSVVKMSVSEEEAFYSIEVSDQASGIPDYARERIFERFYSLPRPQGGKKSSGLGLTLAQEIAGLHGGKVEVVHSDQDGTRIRIVFPK